MIDSRPYDALARAIMRAGPCRGHGARHESVAASDYDPLSKPDRR
jgi:hypothetical protein